MRPPAHLREFLGNFPPTRCSVAYSGPQQRYQQFRARNDLRLGHRCKILRRMRSVFEDHRIRLKIDGPNHARQSVVSAGLATAQPLLLSSLSKLPPSEPSWRMGRKQRRNLRNMTAFIRSAVSPRPRNYVTNALQSKSGQYPPPARPRRPYDRPSFPK
jgi:hypothetical protein